MKYFKTIEVEISKEECLNILKNVYEMNVQSIKFQRTFAEKYGQSEISFCGVYHTDGDELLGVRIYNDEKHNILEIY